MSPSDFAYWLQGFFEITRAGKEPSEVTLDATQVEMIERHLALVLTNVTGKAQPPGWTITGVDPACSTLPSHPGEPRRFC